MNSSDQPTPTDDLVNVIAEALYREEQESWPNVAAGWFRVGENLPMVHRPYLWDELDEDDRESFRGIARNIATALAPHLAEREKSAAREAWSEGGAHVEGRGGYYDPDDNPYRKVVIDRSSRGSAD